VPMQRELSIIIPAYNEERRIRETLIRVLAYRIKERLDAEIIVVDDGSTDRTAEILEEFRDELVVIKINPNRGKGFAVKSGVMAASGKIILFMDADLATDLSEIKASLKDFKRDGANILIGVRNQSSAKRTLIRSIVGKSFALISNIILPLKVKDSQCGFKVFQSLVAKEIFVQLKANRWTFDKEILFIAQKSNLKIVERPVKWQERGNSTVRLSRDIFVMLYELIKIRANGLLGRYNSTELQGRLASPGAEKLQAKLINRMPTIEGSVYAYDIKKMTRSYNEKPREHAAPKVE
ncbi:MAG TPA: glycosyltransferase family 2 protein, partial [bacterium]|nr:glycosyltransferase family 2 protein [bacterium]